MDTLTERDIDQGVYLIARFALSMADATVSRSPMARKYGQACGISPPGQKQGPSFPRGSSHSVFITAACRLRQIFDGAELDQRQTQFQALLHQARFKQLRILFFAEEFSRQQIQS